MAAGKFSVPDPRTGIRPQDAAQAPGAADGAAVGLVLEARRLGGWEAGRLGG